MGRQYTTKFEILKFIDQKEIVSVVDLVDRFPMSENTATTRLKRLKRAGLIEPLGIERGKWVLSIEGGRLFNYLRRGRDDKRRG